MNIKTLHYFTLLAILALLVSGCGSPATPTTAPANPQPSNEAAAPLPPTDIPTEPTPVSAPTIEPSPVPTEPPAPVFDAASLLSTPNLPAFNRTISEVRTGAGTDEQEINNTRSVSLEFDLQESFSHFDVQASGVNTSGEAFTNQAILYTSQAGLLSEIVDLAKVYLSSELAQAYAANNLENPSTSIVESMNAISTTVTSENPFGWVVNPTFVGQEIQNDIPCYHYTFDQSALDNAALPGGMILTAASGEFCLAVDGGYLVHGQGKLEGENLYSSPNSSDIALKTGAIEFKQDVQALQPGFSTAVAAGLIESVSAPDSIPVPADYRLALSQIMPGSESYLYISDNPIDAITAYFKTELPAQGWSLTGSQENGGVYTYQINKDGLNLTITISDGVTLPGIKTISFEKN